MGIRVKCGDVAIEGRESVPLRKKHHVGPRRNPKVAFFFSGFISTFFNIFCFFCSMVPMQITYIDRCSHV
jgi:hypothetical protein